MVNVFKKFIHKFVGGKRNNFPLYYFISLLIMFVCLSLIAYSVFPKEYNMLTNTISDLGGIQSNPEGHLYWDIGVLLLGILLIPPFFYINNILKEFGPKTSKYTLKLAVNSCLCFSMIGAITQDKGLLHYIVATFGFAGFLIKANLEYIYILADHRKTNKFIKKIYFPLGIFYLFYTITMLFTLIFWKFYKYMPKTLFFSFWMWEWMLFFSTIINFFIILAICEHLSKCNLQKIN